MAVKEEAESNICPVCVGSGETHLPISSLYGGRINTYLTTTKNGKEKWRIRVEIKKDYVQDFLDEFGQKGEVVMFIMSKDDIDALHEKPDKINEDGK